ncbi:hypothetical protein SAMN02910292_01466 [Lachnospiraceae bacterium XBB2008]|nr:hypothetical protein SAMN02910292_01466 [Lachnospiraceae bacterium XBB2008]
MPPSGHSSSHHSSSHHSSHSSSHHSSSHSSSRSYSGSSHSSHSSSHHSSYVSPARSNYRSNTVYHRARTSQPYGWNNAGQATIRHFYGVTHDYDYYPQGWTASDGRYFEEGYYDESGRYYGNMVMAGSETMLKCEYCGNHMVYKWKEGDVPVCDKCGAPLRIDITDKETKRQIDGRGSTGDRGFKTVWSGIPVIGKIAVITFVAFLAMPFFLIIFALGLMGVANIRSGSAGYETVSVKNSIYVEEIGRTCYLDGEDWYDSQTECWFYYNDTVSPYQWQYWYEGISSDYGDYGWMEYDMGEDAWYIEADEGNWVHLPEDYDTSMLWHMSDEYTNAYE